MPVATSSSGRALYDHASTAFIHNMPLEALVTVSKAIHTGQAKDTQLLAEQFVILQITTMCAVYAPNEPQRIEVRWQHWRQSNTRVDERESAELVKQLQLPPGQFLTTLWTQALRFYDGARILPSLTASAPQHGQTSIVPQPETLLSALQMPASVVEALVLGALKIDEDIARADSAKSVKKGNSNGSKAIATDHPGVAAARAICEWLLSAHSAITASQSELGEEQQRHLYDQHSRVLRLYALEVLGVRQNEWEYAGEMVRCAKLITAEQREVEERTALLGEIIQAQVTAGSRVERLQASKDRARRIMIEQLEKRKQEAARQQYHSATTSSRSSRPMPSKSTSPVNQISQHLREAPVPQRSAVNGTTHAEDKRPIETPSKPVAAPRRTDGDDKVKVDTKDATASASPNLLSTPSASSLRGMLSAWIRQLGGVTGFALALLAVLITVRRTTQMLRGRLSSASSTTSTTRSGTATRKAISNRPTGPKPGLLAGAWHKLVDTVRMGTQVTYL